jgi:D-alanyl-D-alanine carboxypeptidase
MLRKAAKTIFSKKVLILLAIVITIIGFLAMTLTKSTGQSTSDKVTGDDSQKLIKDNIEKYQPKYEWFEKNPQPIGLTADSAIVLDQNTGQIIFAKEEKKHLPPASITKVLTLIIVLENMNQDDSCTVSREASETQPNKLIMQPGEMLKVRDLLYSMTMISANDSAEVLAECYPGGRGAFIEKMNEKVKELGLSNSNFVDPNGLNDTEQYSSASDMATITRYGILTQPDFLKYLGRKEDYSVPATETNQAHYWYQVSTLLKTYPGMEAAKTGYTHIAHNTYVGVAKRGERRIIIVYFGARTTTNDATQLLDYGLSTEPKL